MPQHSCWGRAAFQSAGGSNATFCPDLWVCREEADAVKHGNRTRFATSLAMQQREEESNSRAVPQLALHLYCAFAASWCLQSEELMQFSSAQAAQERGTKTHTCNFPPATYPISAFWGYLIANWGQQKRKASKARTTRHQHLYWHSRINKPSKVMQSGSCLTGHRELHAKKTQKLTFGIDLL